MNRLHAGELANPLPFAPGRESARRIEICNHENDSCPGVANCARCAIRRILSRKSREPKGLGVVYPTFLTRFSVPLIPNTDFIVAPVVEAGGFGVGVSGHALRDLGCGRRW